MVVKNPDCDFMTWQNLQNTNVHNVRDICWRKAKVFHDEECGYGN